jgi:hypothetical protein
LARLTNFVLRVLTAMAKSPVSTSKCASVVDGKARGKTTSTSRNLLNSRDVVRRVPISHKLAQNTAPSVQPAGTAQLSTPFYGPGNGLHVEPHPAPSKLISSSFIASRSASTPSAVSRSTSASSQSTQKQSTSFTSTLLGPSHAKTRSPAVRENMTARRGKRDSVGAGSGRVGRNPSGREQHIARDGTIEHARPAATPSAATSHNKSTSVEPLPWTKRTTGNENVEGAFFPLPV